MITNSIRAHSQFSIYLPTFQTPYELYVYVLVLICENRKYFKMDNYLPFGWLIELEGALREVVADADCCVETY